MSATAKWLNLTEKENAHVVAGASTSVAMNVEFHQGSLSEDQWADLTDRVEAAVRSVLAEFQVEAEPTAVSHA